MAQPTPYSNLPTPEQIAWQRKLGGQMMQQGMDASPVQHWTQGLARVLQGGVGGYRMSQADNQQRERSDGLVNALRGSSAFKGLGESDFALMGADPDLMRSTAAKVYSNRLDPQAGVRNQIMQQQLEQQRQEFAFKKEMHPIELDLKRKALQGEQYQTVPADGQLFNRTTGQFIDVPGGGKIDATTKKAIDEADDFVLQNQAALNALKKAQQLNAGAYDGVGAGPRAAVVNNIPLLGGTKSSLDTAELENVITNQALQSLRSVFGGNPTEGERKILLDVQGSIGQPREIRKRIFAEAQRLAEIRLEFNRQKATSLRSGRYYRPDGQPQQIQPPHLQGVAPPPPQEPAPAGRSFSASGAIGRAYPYTATNPATGQRIRSRDGVNWEPAQ